jgi:hypothetical protein
MLLALGLSGSASLPNIYKTALTGDVVYTADLQTQFFIDRTEHVDSLDVMFGQQSDLICDTVLVRLHGYTGRLHALPLWFMSLI